MPRPTASVWRTRKPATVIHCHELEDDAAYWKEWFVAGNKISTPVCVLWSERGPVARHPVLKVWRTAAHDVRRAMIPRCAHYLQEEQPDLVVRHILRFANDLGIP